MQKKLLTIAVAAALAAPVAAMADVTVYGQMHFSVDWVDAGEAANGNDDSELNTGVSRESRIGFKGAEDLGGGLKGVWQIEMKVGDEGNDFVGETQYRNTFVGLSGGFGTVLLGRHDTPYKLSTGKLDFFTDRAADYNNLLGTIGGITTNDERAPQTIAYVTPNWSGFSAAAAYVSHYFNNDDDDQGYSLMAMYDNAGFFATLAYESYEGAVLTSVTGLPAGITGDEGVEVSAWKAGLGYTFGGFTVGGIYENLEAEDSDSDTDRDAWYLTAQYAFGSNVIKGYYGMADDLDGIEDSGADFWAIGYDYNFSKRTTLYALYTMVDNDDNVRYGANKGQAVSDSYRAARNGEEVSVFSLGVIHKF